MNLRTVLLLLIFALLAVFAAVNWAAFTQPTLLSLGVATVEAPLGVILLGVIAALSVLFLAFVAYLQGTVIVESRRTARELQAQRELADKAEASRFSSLRELLSAEVGRLHERIDRLDHDFGAAFDRNEGSMAAYVGELGDRVDTLAGLKKSAPP